MREFIRSLTEKMGINGLGRALGLNGSSVLAWVRGESLPSADLIPQLAKLAHWDAADLMALLIQAQEERAARRRLRPPVGTATRLAVPSRKRSRTKARRVLGLAWALASAWSLWGPLRGVDARPIMDASYLRVFIAEVRDSVAFRRRWALA